MEIEAASAPYQQGYPAATAFSNTHMPMFAPQALMQPQAPQAPTQPPAAPIQPNAPTPPPEAPFSPRVPSCEAPYSPFQAPSCDAYPNKQAMLDERLRAIEAAERRLAARLAELQQLAAQINLAERREAAAMDTADRRVPPPITEPIRELVPPATVSGHAIQSERFPIRTVQYEEPALLPLKTPAPVISNGPSGRITGLRNR
jgi:hypothetical protein